MISAAWGRVPNRFKVDLVVWLLIPFAFIGGAFLTLNFKTVTITRTVHVGTPLSAMTAAAVAAAWGKPDSRVAGATVNANLAGTTCDIWQAKRAVLCF